MASSMAAAAAHSMPPFPLPIVPRIRPPAIPKGTPGPNTLPQPQKLAPKPGLVWVDGRWAHPTSNSAKHKSQVISKQLEKALQHEVHGMNIYAYKHMRTNQVVYSLSKNMDNNKILKQLIFHGKQTVPSALRRDLWRPYFSIHFPKTPAGAVKGLKVFKELRELSFRRQHDPPRELVYTTEKDVVRFHRNRDPISLKDLTEQKTDNRGDKYRRVDLPIVGMKVPARILARRLMNQRATSVADVAAVLSRMVTDEGARKRDSVLTPQQDLARVKARKQESESLLSDRAHKRLISIREQEHEKEEELKVREEYLVPRSGQAQIARHTLARLSTEYDGAIASKDAGETYLGMIEQKYRATAQEIGAQEKLNQILSDIQAEKDTARESIAKALSAQIDQEIQQMSDTQRSQILKDVEEQGAQRQQEIDVRVSEARQQLKDEKTSLYAQIEQQGKTKENMQALRILSRDRPKEISQMKMELQKRHVQWVGPYAKIASQVDDAVAEIDRNYETRLQKSRDEVSAERQRYGDVVNHEVEIRWSDIRDGTYAKDWPDSVFHGELQAKAVVKFRVNAVRQHFHFDAEEVPIHEQSALTDIPLSNSVHVFGAEVPESSEGRWQSPADASEAALQARNQRVQEWQQTSPILIRDKILSLREESKLLQPRFEESVNDPQTMQSLIWIVEALERAREASVGLVENGFNEEESRTIDSMLSYATENLHYARQEVEASVDQDGGNAYLAWIQLQTQLIRLESQHLEAYAQANLREEFFQQFDERYDIVNRVRNYENVDPEAHDRAVSDLSRFDYRFPFVVEAIQRAEASDGVADELRAVETQLATQMSGTGLSATTVEETEKGRIQLNEQRAELMKKRRDHGKIDREAWIEFKTRGGTNAYIGQRIQEQKARSAATSKTQEEVVHDTSGFWGRVTSIFGRK